MTEPQPTLFIVDDEPNNLMLFRRSVAECNYTVHDFADGHDALEALRQGLCPDLILSDVMMPKVSGYELCERVKAHEDWCKIPLVLVTGLNEIKDKIRGLEAGADDFIHKPFHPLELRARVRSLLRIKQQSDQLEKQNQLLSDSNLLLEQRVRERTAELEDITHGLTAALERANRMNDEDTGNHIKRVCKVSELLAHELGLDSATCLKIGRFASLHDVGKVGIPDAILKKPGRLTPEEWVEMKRHTLYGYEILRLAGSDEVAQNIALCHHEKFDGTGYPYGLVGETIPLEARIVAIADVFDALTSKRVYKEAFSLEKSEDYIRANSGLHFDPAVVDILFKSRDQVIAIKNEYRDTAGEPWALDETVTMEIPPAHIRRRIEATRGGVSH
ncbi:MAG: HD domain-containing phosphohydrolase [Myxococcota bacterium]|nr:HD domain-containing phosphohydrolase [Myxococcota bacterium]